MLSDVPLLGQLFGTAAGSGAARGSILTIRVKKSDADAFAKDRLTLDEFRKAARISIYAGDAGGWGDNAASRLFSF